MYHRLTPLEDGSAAEVLSLISDALVSSLLPSEVSAPPGGELLSSLLAHGALRRALSLVSSPGWLAMQLAEAITGESLSAEAVNLNQTSETPILEAEDAITLETFQSDADAESVQVKFYLLLYFRKYLTNFSFGEKNIKILCQG